MTVTPMRPEPTRRSDGACGRVRGLALAVLLGSGPALVPAPLLAQEEAAPGAAPTREDVQLHEEKVQDWTLVCGSLQEEGPEQCEMRQQTDRVVAVIGALPNRAEPGMLIFVPLGIILPAGVVLQIDGGAERTLQVQRCVPESCQVELILEEDLLRQMRNGTKATFTYAIPDGQGQVDRIQGELSLLGFTAALNRVQS